MILRIIATILVFLCIFSSDFRVNISGGFEILIKHVGVKIIWRVYV